MQKRFFRISIVLLLYCYYNITLSYAVEVGDPFDIQINHENYECKKKDPYAYDYYYNDYKPKKPCTIEDFIPCQGDLIISTLSGENIFSSYISCESSKVVIKCNEEVLQTCDIGENSMISLEEANEFIYFLEQNCLCNSTDHYLECADPCTAKPCLNGGKCILKEMETKTDDYYYDYYYSDVKKEFKECQCQAPYSGEFCQNCETCEYTCKATKKCTCPNKEYAGPFCNIPCSDVKSERVSLLRSCTQVGFDLYFLYPQPSGCVLAMVVDDCIAASFNQCEIDLTEGFKDYHLLEAYKGISARLLAQRCIVFGDPPFTL